PFADAEPGAIGLETLLSAALRLYHNVDVPLLRSVDALSSAPATRFGLPAGPVAPGARADLIPVAQEEPAVGHERAVRSRGEHTCFEGARLQGKVLQTLVAGRTVHQA